MSKHKNLIPGILFIVIVFAITVYTSLPEKGGRRLSMAERRIISRNAPVMYVLDVSNPEDSTLLRRVSHNFTNSELKSKDYIKLARKMLRTVQSPQYEGVGLAAPQVGINHRLVVVCRTDKAGEPFELYPNIRIDSLYGEVKLGPEGCLSIPPYRGIVPRYSDIIISYKDLNSMTDIREHVSGYAAVIFQHECDHLDGILFTDKADSVAINEPWASERTEFEQKGLYERPEWL